MSEVENKPTWDTLFDDVELAGDDFLVELYEPPVMSKPKDIDVLVPGRKKKSNNEIIREYPDIVIFLRDGQGIRETARKTGRSVNTVQRVKKALAN